MLRYWNALASAQSSDDLFSIYPLLPRHFATENIEHEGKVTRIWQRRFAYPLKIKTQFRGKVAHILDHSWADMIPHVPRNASTVVTVHDLIPLRFPGELTLAQTKRFKSVVGHIKQADRVICVSEYTKKEVMNLLGIPESKLRIVSNGVEQFTISEAAVLRFRHKIQTASKLPLEVDSLFLLGSIGNTSERKNLAILAPALKKAKSLGMEVLFVRAGAPLPASLRKELHAAIGHDRLIELGQLRDEELGPFYQSMDAVAIPSTYEGFGLPVLEAMAAGTVIISSNSTSLPEVGGDAALYFDPHSPEDFAKCLIACQDRKLREHLIKLGQERVQHFSWRRCLEKTYQIYSELLEPVPKDKTASGSFPSLAITTKIKIAAVFASYNRKDAALKCLQHLRNQSHPVDLVVVADNASHDGSREAMAAIEWDVLQILDTGDNLGNAGGIKAAMDHAFLSGADAVWVLDDDSWPEPEALEELLATPWNPNVVRHSLQIDPRNGLYSWPLPVRNKSFRWTTLRHPSEWPKEEEHMESRAAWTGALISQKIWESVGPVMASLFIRGEDEEYPRRISEAGFHFEAVRDSILTHPSANGLIRWGLFEKEFWYEPGLAAWKLYYEARNTIWIKRNNKEWIYAIGLTVAFILALIAYGPRSVNHFKSLGNAIMDAWKDRLGRKHFSQ